jgi:hypothetical protein
LIIREERPISPEGAAYVACLVRSRREEGRTIRAIERGEILPARRSRWRSTSYGPIHHRVLHGRAPLDDRFIRDVIHTALGGKRSSLSAPLTWLM